MTPSDEPQPPAYPPPASPPLRVAPPPPPPHDGGWTAASVEPVPGTEFGLVRLQVPPVSSGLATGSLIAGIGSILVSFLVLCFGLSGSSAGWGGWVAGAFTVLGVLSGGGSVALGVIALRQIRRSGQPGRMRFTGRGRAIAGIVCGATGVGISFAALALSLVFQIS